MHQQATLDHYNDVIDTAVRPLRGPMEVAYLEPPEIWQKIRPHLERAVKHEHLHGMTVDRLARGIQSGGLRVWIWRDFKAIFLTSLNRQANGRLTMDLNWTVGTGCLPHHDEILPIFEAYARQQGCYAMVATGRKGWERVLKPYGYQFMHTTWAKEL